VHPFEGRDQIHQAIVSGGALSLCREQRVREPAEQAQAVLHGHHNHALAGKRRDEIPRRILGAADPFRPAVNEHHHRLFVTGGPIDREDVQSETVFVPLRLAVSVDLRARVAKDCRVAHALPAGRRRRRTPTQVAYRRCGEGNPAEGTEGSFNSALELTRLGADDGRSAHTPGRRWGVPADAAGTTAIAAATTGQKNKDQ